MSKSIYESLGQVEPTQINEELQAIGVTTDEQEELFQQFWKNDIYNSIILYRPYLDLLITFIKRRKSASFQRYEYIRYITDTLLDKSQRTIFQKIASSMELMEVNGLPKEEFVKLLTILETDLVTINFDHLIQNKFLTFIPDKNGKEEIPKVQFFHHSIQEYLATEYILDSDQPLNFLRKLVEVNQEGTPAIKPSWYNVIRFIVEIETQNEEDRPITNWLLDMGLRYGDTIINENYANTLTSINPERTSIAVRKQIFDLIYNSYKNKLLWLPLWGRNSLANIITDDQLNELKDHIKTPEHGWSSEKQRYVYLGIVTEIVKGVLESAPNRLSDSDKLFWLNNFIDFATDENDNGVLQRTALHALGYYKSATDEKFNIDLIKKVEKVFNNGDELVKQAFIQFISTVAPNSKIAIDYLSKSLEDDRLSIYARHALYEINTFEGIKYLLQKLGSDPTLLYHFLDKESIFNDDDKNADSVLIKVISPHSKETIKDNKQVIMQAYGLTERYWHNEHSYFINELFKMVAKEEPDYIFELVAYANELTIKKKWRALYDFTSLFAQNIRPDQVKRFFEEVKKIDGEQGQRVAEHVIYSARLSQNVLGKEVYEIAIKNNYINDISAPDSSIDYKQIENEKIIKEFKRRLEPEPGKYMTDVFKYYLNNENILNSHPIEIDRLKKLLINSGLIIEPRKIRVKIPDKNVSSYNITTTAHIYGDVLRVAKKLLPESLMDIRQNIIDFIPFAFSNDQSTIFELIPDITNDELEKFVNKVYRDKENDTRYLLPSSYISLIERYAKKGNKLSTAIPIMESFIDDTIIKPYDKLSALETLGILLNDEDISKKKYLQEIFSNNLHASHNSDQKKMSEMANALLITIYHDSTAIEWRFNEIINRVAPFKPPQSLVAHSVGEFEDELDHLYFAKPLITLKDPALLNETHYLRLIDQGFKLTEKPKEELFQSYTYYLWHIVVSAVKQMSNQGVKPLNKLKSYLKKYSNNPEINWWNYKLEELNQIFATNTESNKDINSVVALVSERRKNGT